MFNFKFILCFILLLDILLISETDGCWCKYIDSDSCKWWGLGSINDRPKTTTPSGLGPNGRPTWVYPG